MALARGSVVRPKHVKILAAIIVGLSIGTLLEPEPLVLPALGPVPGLVVSVIGLSIGIVLYHYIPQQLAPSSCGCTGDCSCS